MQVLINSDNQVSVNGELTKFIQEEIERALGRFEDRLTRVDVFLSDLNGPKTGSAADKRCVIETRPSGRQPVTASDDAGTMTEAISGAVSKMRRQLDSTFGRASDKR
jgi:ribosomal subunit interface protein